MILVTGAAGFTGGATVAALVRRGARVRAVVHHRPAAWARTPDTAEPEAAGPDTAGPESVSGVSGVPAVPAVSAVPGVAAAPAETVTADLTDPSSLAGLCDGVSAVVHLAAYIGEDPERCAAVNVDGTLALLAEARRAGVRRFVQLSTAAVYGDGAHTGPDEDALTPDPVSVLSRSRLLAEHAVLAGGGTVLRPMFVYGPGDRWFVPPLAQALTALPVRVNGGAARLSLLDVADLAEAFAVLATTDGPGGPDTDRGRIYHAAHPEPVTLDRLMGAFTAHLGVPEPTADIGFEEALAFLADAPDLARRLRLIAFDHYYDASRLWRRTGLVPGMFDDRFAARAPWYRARLDASG
ncbi:NAD(P)-dependent oxidoreductase [Streptomyces sp. LP05-1]|uniref:NAD(P)-dependent oxidoreductase n=1 Tax=Streptomyces pyxinae TaxID=2970734 RepID=A0ABT2CBF6_9ACTN|nr:NAD(P)-dependent oxidoreductase [Streptomyces sp. LP05-1]MCS0634747.1 NAD(P)-dependent oxidoreductase [Streptomyces sp. LP05-1]